VRHTMDVLATRFGDPDELTLSDGGIWTGPASFRHPAAPGGAPPGLCYRGIPLLPPPATVEGAPWAGSLPADGVRVAGDGDLRRLIDRLTAGPAGRRTR
jgi:hypothetical protein